MSTVILFLNTNKGDWNFKAEVRGHIVCVGRDFRDCVGYQNIPIYLMTMWLPSEEVAMDNCLFTEVLVFFIWVRVDYAGTGQ